MPKRPERSGRKPKLTPADILAIKTMLDAGARQEAIAKRFGVTRPYISYVKTGGRLKFADEVLGTVLTTAHYHIETDLPVADCPEPWAELMRAAS
jgi:hypothetical protein